MLHLKIYKRNFRIIITPSFLILIILSLSGSACIKKSRNKEIGNSSEINNSSLVLEDRLANMKKYLTNREVSSLSKILSEPKPKAGARILLSYTGSDCSSCVETSFQLISGLKEEYKQKVIALAAFASVGNDQLRFNYDQLIYSDASDLLRKELKYYYTPVVLIIDPLNIIRSVFFVTSYGDKKTQAADFYKFIDDNLKM